MKPQRLFGILCLIAAAVLLYVGNDASKSFSDQMSNVFTGRFTERTTWLFAGGIAAGMLGLFMAFTSTRTRHA